jgi:hypothetical protein
MSSASRRPPERDPKPASRHPPGRPALPSWLALGLGLLGLCGLLFILPEVQQLAATWSWRPAPATLETIQRQISPASFPGLSGQHGKFRLFSRRQESITYSYSVNGRSYMGSDVVSELPPGKLTISYDPARPQQSVARRPGAARVLAAFGLALALVLYGFRGLRRSARRPTESKI